MSPKFSLDGVDINKVLTGILIGLAGIGITVFTMLAGANYHFAFGGFDFSPFATMFASLIFSALVNLCRKYIADNSK